MTRTSAADIRHLRGFTLLELLMVLGILAMMATLIGPGLNSLDSPSFNAQVREASSLLNYARRRSVVEGQMLRVEFVPAGVVPESSDSAGLAGRWVSTDMELWFAASTERSQRQESVVSVSFFPEGGSTGGELSFRQGVRQRILTVDPFSGRVSARNED
ncbi:MAG: prepilin-type N-terminal cleavage/methylation domain-containing protein [Pseudohongiella sp.]|nr:prepilin-type N-terminal cleavage/methylation domain-containing protein [Pseudohongiella sp.]